MKEINDFLLNLFTSGNDSQPRMMFPNMTDGIVHATDSQVLISIPGDELSLRYKSNEKFPKAQRVIDEAQKNSTESVKVKVSDLAKQLANARIIIDKIYKKCDECDGSGEVKWTYSSKKGYYHYKDCDCPECGGDSTLESEHPFPRVHLGMIETENGQFVGINIGDLYFHPFQLYRLLLVALIKGYESIEIFYNPYKWTTISYFGNIKVVITLMERGYGN